MTDTNPSQNKSGASSVISQNDQNSLWNPGWKMPESGVFGIDFWADMWKVDAKTIVKWIKKYNIRFYGPNASNCYIDVNEFLTSMSRDPGDEAE